MKISLLFVAYCSVLWSQQAMPDWHFVKDDPATRKHALTIHAASFQSTSDPPVIQLHKMVARIYQADGSTFKEVISADAVFNERLGTLRYGPHLSQVIKLR
jgi:hypothetical protein